MSRTYPKMAGLRSRFFPQAGGSRSAPTQSRPPSGDASSSSAGGSSIGYEGSTNLSLDTRLVQETRSAADVEEPSQGSSQQSRASTQNSRQQRFQWTKALKTDLVTCYYASEPKRRGYMGRMHTLWCEKHPELSHIKPQYLRDQAARLKKTGFDPPVSITDMNRNTETEVNRRDEREPAAIGVDESTRETLVAETQDELSLDEPVLESGSSDIETQERVFQNTSTLPVLEATSPTPSIPGDTLSLPVVSAVTAPPLTSNTEANVEQIPILPVEPPNTRLEELKDLFRNALETNNDLYKRKRPKYRKTFAKAQDLAFINQIVDDHLTNSSSLLDIDSSVYAAMCALSPPTKSTETAEEKTRKRIEQLDSKLTPLRQTVSRIECVSEYQKTGRPFTPKVRSFARELRHQHHTLNKGILLTIKQRNIEKIRALALARKKLVKREKCIRENKIFLSNPSRLFAKPPSPVENPPSVEQIEGYWRELYEKSTNVDKNIRPIKLFERFCNAHLAEQAVITSVTADEVSLAFKGKKNHSAPGMDAVSNFWWKRLPSTHTHLARQFTSYILGYGTIPTWFSEGRTVLIPKKGDLSVPSNYRPITCLNTVYKAFTSILNERILTTIEPVWMMINEQRGSKRGISGCKDNLLVDRCICQDARQYQRDLSMAWVDYRKAFDTTSHQLILVLLKCLKIHPDIIRCIEELLPLWKTKFTIRSGKRSISTELVTYKRGVYQGDSLSPLLFCISLMPLSLRLREEPGYRCGPPTDRKHQVTHLFYMDDLKLYASSESSLSQALKSVHQYTKAIGMEFGLDKCAVIHCKRGRVPNYDADAQLTDGSIVKHLDEEELYTYLGVGESHIQCVSAVKKALRGRYRHRLRQIWESELSGIHKIRATNMLALPIILYSFGSIKWTIEELKELDRGTRKLMNICRSLHPRASVPRNYLPRQQGGRGLLSVECLHDRIVLGVACQVTNSSDPLMELVRQHELQGKGAFLFSAAQHAASKLGLVFDPINRDRDDNLVLLPKSQLRSAVKRAEISLHLEDHRNRDHQGMFYRHLDSCGLSVDLTFSFLRSAGLKSETEGFIIAAQDGVIATLTHRKYVCKEAVSTSMCRACKTQPETLMHLISACPSYAANTYIHRHNAALRVLYYFLRHKYGVDPTPVLPYAPGEIESVVKNEKCIIFWNFPFATTRQLSATKPDIVLQDILSKTMYVIEFSAPAETNIVLKEEQKRTKYLDLLQELRQLHPGYSVKMVVLIIGCLGGIRPTLEANLSQIPVCRSNLRHLISAMQKAVIIGTLRTLRSHQTVFK